jgi:hypothetical protein
MPAQGRKVLEEIEDGAHKMGLEPKMFLLDLELRRH